MKGHVDATTSNGRIYTDFGDAAAKVTRQTRTRLEAELNGGGAGLVLARTSNSSVTLEFEE